MTKSNVIPLIEAHRGDSSNAPENTLAAFQRAIELGAPWIELDVHPAKDGALMVIHDDTVDRTTTCSGPVCDMTVDELRRCDAGIWFGPQFAGEKIPLLEEVLEMVEQTDVQLNIEIKASPPGLDTPKAVVDLVRRFGKAHQYIISSFDLDSLLQVQAVDPEIALALIGNGPEILSPAQRHHLAWIHINYRFLNERIVAEAHTSGIRVNVWTVDDPAALPRLKAIGVDKVCTNRLAVMLAAGGT